MTPIDEMLHQANSGLSLIAAIGQHNEIGKNRKLLWSIPNDMRYFKNTTWGFPVIMGRITFEDLPKALAGRTNIVVSRKAASWQNALAVKSTDEAVKEAIKLKTSEIFVIGGGQIYKDLLPHASRLYITRVHSGFADADTHFPDVNWDEWDLLRSEEFEADENNEFSHRIELWERKVKP